MSAAAVQNARPWFEQAASDLRAALALYARPAPMTDQDVGCHVAALCSQAMEKSLKGYLLLNGMSPAIDHRPDKYLATLLAKDNPLLRYAGHHAHLSRLFDQDSRRTLSQLLDLTPGGLGKRTDVPSTEYPWREEVGWRHAPVEHAAFSDAHALRKWVTAASRMTTTLDKLRKAVDRGTSL